MTLELVDLDNPSYLILIDLGPIDQIDELTVVSLYVPDQLDVIDLGSAAVIPPTAAFNTVSLLSQEVISDKSTLIIDRSLGEYVILTLTNSLDMLSVINWPPSGYLGRIHLDITNTGNFTINFSRTGVMAPYQYVPPLTPNGNDFITLTTIDNGTTVKVNLVGQNYLNLQ